MRLFWHHKHVPHLKPAAVHHQHHGFADWSAEHLQHLFPKILAWVVLITILLIA